MWTDPDSALYKKINLLGTAWCQDWPSAATFLPVIVGCENPTAYNTGNFSEQSVDDEIARIKTLPIEEQADAWGELEQTVMSDYQPVINTGYYQVIFGIGIVHRRVRQRHLRRWCTRLPDASTSSSD